LIGGAGGYKIEGEMKVFAKILRILANVLTFPALIFFFYFILRAIDPERSSGSATSYVLAVIILASPIAFNLVGRYLDKSTW